MGRKRILVSPSGYLWTDVTQPDAASRPTIFITKETTMKHHNHIQLPTQIERRLFEKRMNRRAEAAYGFLLALAIGVGLAAVLFYGWSK